MASCYFNITSATTTAGSTTASCWADSGTSSAGGSTGNYTYDFAGRRTLISGTWVSDYERWQNPEAYETEEQKQARIQRQKEQEVAKAKAEELLKEHIGLEDFDKLHEIGHIELDSQKYAGRKYRIPSNARSLIEIVENGKVVDRLCVHPDLRYPDDDEILARILLLKFDEERVLKVANHNLVRV